MHRPEPTSQPPAQHYDYARFGRHKLRAPNAAIIDLPVPVAPAAQRWVATIWPDPHTRGGWARQLWTLDPATGRGWQLPHQLAAGDVVEFGADAPEQPVRWYGIMDSYEVNEWTTVQGPYPDPATAWDEAQRLVALERYVDPLHPEPATVPAVATAPAHQPRRGHCHHHRYGRQQ